jgi:hypothetical protein
MTGIGEFFSFLNDGAQKPANLQRREEELKHEPWMCALRAGAARQRSASIYNRNGTRWSALATGVAAGWRGKRSNQQEGIR